MNKAVNMKTKPARNAGGKPRGKPSAKAHKLFDLLDADKSGSLSRVEVVNGVARMITSLDLNVTSQYLQLIGSTMSRSDVDKSGTLDRREFGFFLYHLAETLNMPLDQLAKNLMESNRNTSSTESYNAEEKRVLEKEIPALFAKYDVSGNGLISHHEISVAMRKITSDDAIYGTHSIKSLSYSELMDLFDENDTDENGELELAEFTNFLSSFSLACGIPLKEVVSYLRRDAVSFQEIDLVLEGRKMVPYLFSIFDTDHDGSINKHELVDHMGDLVKELGLDMKLADIWDMFSSVNNDLSHDIDRHEFALFLSEFAKAGNVGVEEITFYLSKVHRKGRSNHIVHDSLGGWGDIEKLFELWDTDDDGHIDRRELFTRLSSIRKEHNLTSVEFLKMMHDVDENDDDELDRHEFAAFLSKIAARTGIKLEEVIHHLVECSPTHRGLKDSGESSNSTLGWNDSIASIWSWASVQLAEEALETVNQVEELESIIGDQRSFMKKRLSSSFGNLSLLSFDLEE